MTSRDARLDELNGKLERLLAVEPGEEGAIHELNDLGPREASLREDGAASRELELKVDELEAYLAKVTAEREIAVSYLVRAMDGGHDLVDSLDNKKLAKNYYKVGPRDIDGNDKHNERVAKHLKALEAENLVRDRSAKFEDLAGLAYRGLLKEAEDYVKKMYGESKNPDISKETRKKLMARLPTLRAERSLADLKRDKSTLRMYADVGAKELRKEFDKSFDNEEERREYTAANIRESYREAGDKKGHEKLIYLAQVAKTIGEVDKTKV